ncbi:uncharacterized protein LOC133188990 [Saccostrea echinata]|uniref:uncharacterized protein LOC133188990 n=1 Tax=Saccostrea echinata TaxID=191078 RepID=UPI002A8186AE|nr:uncharacterized protein LOC133188990 [Saccostrea echinata]
MMFLIIAIVCGFCTAELIEKEKTEQVDLKARNDLALLVNSEYENTSAKALQMLTTCNNSVNAAIAYCSSNCQSSGGGGGDKFQQLLQDVDNTFKKIGDDIKKVGPAIETEFNKFKATVDAQAKKLGTSIKNWADKQQWAKDAAKFTENLAKNIGATIASKAKEWFNSVKNWGKNTLNKIPGVNLRRKRAVTCDTCTQIANAAEDKMLETVCGADTMAEIFVLTTLLDRMSTMMASMEATLVNELDADTAKTTVKSYVPLVLTAPLTSVKYTVNGTASVVSGGGKEINLGNTDDIADVVAGIIYADYFKI